MSLPSPTGQRALDVPSTPVSPLTQASLGRTGQVLTQAPLGTQPTTTGRLVLSSQGASALIVQYYSQVYGWAADTIVPVSSWDDVGRELGARSSIGELVILSHATHGGPVIGAVQLSGTDFASRFATVAPPIGSLSFDGCAMGSDLVGLHSIALRMRIQEVRAWTYWHYMDWWRKVPLGNIDDAVAKFQPLAVAASPWLPKSLDGRSVYTQGDQESLFAANKLNLLAEYFVHSLDDEVGPSFEAAIDAKALDLSKHRPRGSADFRTVRSSDEQEELGREIDSESHKLFSRVTMTPWQ